MDTSTHALKTKLLNGELDAHEAIALFQSLPEVQPQDMLGEWAGREIRTGHHMEGLLDHFGWAGKRFASVDEVDPLLFRSSFGVHRMPPRLMFMGYALPRFVVNSPVTALLFKWLTPLLSTRKSKARLRLTQQLNKTTATMVYDELPIHDAFVWLDANSLLGAMDMKGDAAPYFFMLFRQP